MGKFLFFLVVGAAVYLIWLRGAGLRKRELADAQRKSPPDETLVFDPEKRAYVPKSRANS